MATSYEKCYEVFLRLVNDVEVLYPLEGESDTDFQLRIDTLLLEMFKSAVVKFSNPITSLKRNDATLTFDNDLRDVEIEIIGMFMLREYYRKQLNFLVALKHSFSDKDWKSHDKANQMNQYRQLLKELEDEIKPLVIDNTFKADDGSSEWWTNE
jgi:hypothetical protein